MCLGMPPFRMVFASPATQLLPLCPPVQDVLEDLFRRIRSKWRDALHATTQEHKEGQRALQIDA